MSLGFLFPGQGSQSVGMLAELADAFPIIGETFAEADDALNLALTRIVQEGPAERLSETEITQPALLTSSVALWRLWQSRGGEVPVLFAGHSLGEYSALVCGGAVSFAEGVRLVHQRGRLMQQAVPRGEGAMAAILGLDDDTVAQCCARVDGVVSPANFNAPSQVVIAGSAAAVAAAVAECTAAGAKRAVELNVSGPFHCALMAPVRDPFAQELDRISLGMPVIPVVHNVDAATAADAGELREKLLEQLARPVLWTRCVEQMIAAGVDRFVECGPGKVLGGLVKRIDRSKVVHNIDSIAGLEAALSGQVERTS